MICVWACTLSGGVLPVFSFACVVSLLLTLSCLFGFVVRAEILAFLDLASSSNTG